MYWLIPSLFFLLQLALIVALVSHVLLRRHGNSETRLPWIMLIILIPFVGAIAYLLLGAPGTGKRARRHAKVHGCFTEAPHPRSIDLAGIEPNVPRHYQQVFSLAEALADTDAMAGHQLELLAGGEGFFDRLIEDIDAATATCHLLTYIYLDDTDGRRVADALVRAAGRGVQCRVLADAHGSKAFLKSRTHEQMRKAGVAIIESRPTHIISALWARMDVRNHRKIFVIDNRTGYIGSQNIASESFAPKARYAPWVDCMMRMEGPAIRDLQELFIEDWYLDSNEDLSALLHETPKVIPEGSTVQIIGSGPNFKNEVLSMIFQGAINAADDELILTTPYFVPDQATSTAIRAAALRGVRTTLVLPARNDSKLVALASQAHYGRLLEAGVEIHEFEAGLLHAKTMTIDRQLYMVGSANLDRRSLELNFEASMFGYDSEIASRLRFLQSSYLEQSTQVEETLWGQRGPLKRMTCNAAGLLAPLL